jgi:hypothetical protein
VIFWFHAEPSADMENAAPFEGRGIFVNRQCQPTSVEWMRFSTPGVRLRLLVSLLSAPR